MSLLREEEENDGTAAVATVLRYPAGFAIEPQSTATANAKGSASVTTVRSSGNRRSASTQPGTNCSSERAFRSDDEKESDTGVTTKPKDMHDDNDVPRAAVPGKHSFHNNGHRKESNSIEQLVPGDVRLAQTIVNEIVEAELRGDDHCEVLLESALVKWGGQVIRQVPDAGQFWDRVNAMLLQRIDYSVEETKWTDGGDAKRTVNINLSEWDTFEVLSLGFPPAPAECDKT